VNRPKRRRRTELGAGVGRLNKLGERLTLSVDLRTMTARAKSCLFVLEFKVCLREKKKCHVNLSFNGRVIA
jgi:hypothetical protein